MRDGWGFLGKPPQDILDGTASNERMERFRDLHMEMSKAAAITNTKRRMVEMAKVRAKYNLDILRQGYDPS